MYLKISSIRKGNKNTVVIEGINKDYEQLSDINWFDDEEIGETKFILDLNDRNQKKFFDNHLIESAKPGMKHKEVIEACIGKIWVMPDSYKHN